MRFRFQRHWPPASVSSGVRQYEKRTFVGRRFRPQSFWSCRICSSAAAVSRKRDGKLRPVNFGRDWGSGPRRRVGFWTSRSFWPATSSTSFPGSPHTCAGFRTLRFWTIHCRASCSIELKKCFVAEPSTPLDAGTVSCLQASGAGPAPVSSIVSRMSFVALNGNYYRWAGYCALPCVLLPILITVLSDSYSFLVNSAFNVLGLVFAVSGIWKGRPWAKLCSTLALILFFFSALTFIGFLADYLR